MTLQQSDNNMHKSQRIFKTVGGFTLLILGFLLSFSPAPGIPLILCGLAMLATDYVWARRLLQHVKKQTSRLRNAVLTYK